jgi:hypothetical protein
VGKNSCDEKEMENEVFHLFEGPNVERTLDEHILKLRNHLQIVKTKVP